MYRTRLDHGLTRARCGAAGVTVCAAMIAVLAAGCGSSKSTKTSSATASAQTTTKAAAAHLRTVPGVPAPAGARQATPSSVKLLPSVPKPSGPTAHIKGLSGQPVAVQVSALDGDLNQFWSKAFAGSKYKWPQTQEAIVQNAPISTNCSAKPTIAPTDPPLLCNHVFFWTVPWIQQNVNPQGGVALTFTASILWSLYAEDNLGNTSALQSGQVTKAQYGNQSLCFTGLYFRTLGARSLFETGDSQLASKFLGSLGGVDQITAPDVTPQSLTKAFEDGYHGGSFSSCSLQAMTTP